MIFTERSILYILFVAALLFDQSCSSRHNNIQYTKWYLQGSVLSARESQSFDNIAVKDPSIVFFQDKYHLFCTVKSKQSNNLNTFSTGCAYVKASSLQELNKAERYNFDSITGINIIAPQIFYFEPQELWYLIAHTPATKGNLSVLKPIYLTNDDIENINGWSQAKELVNGKFDDSFWIDFWVICDDKSAFLFYSDQKGSVFRLQCPVDNFPEGFSINKPALALYENHLDEEKSWKMFEAVHIYYVKKEQKYLALLEGAYKHVARKGDVDARNRFIFGMSADSLNGNWARVEKSPYEFLAEAGNLFYPDERVNKYTMISHPELIRSGYNQRLEIEDFQLSMIFQAFDGSIVPDSYNYSELPWELVLAKNF